MYFDVRPSILQQEKIALCEAQNWRCCYCKFPVRMVFGECNDQDAATREHLIPRAKNGGNDYENLIIACLLCNKVRDHANPYRFEQTVMRLLNISPIKRAWHKFTPVQVSLLRQEIEFGAIIVKANKKNNAGSLNAYAARVASRQRLIAKIRAQ